MATKVEPDDLVDDLRRKELRGWRRTAGEAKVQVGQ